MMWDSFYEDGLLHILMQTNKTEVMPLRLRGPVLAHKKLSNINEDLQIQEQIRMPVTSRPKKKGMHNSDRLQNKLKRIINLNSTRRNKSVQSHNSFYKDTIGPTGLLKNAHLPVLTPVKQRSNNKSVLDNILTRQDDFSKAYFVELQKRDRARKKQVKEEEDVDFEFPQIKVGNWKIIGLIKENHILLKGSHKDSRVCIKKYDYTKVYSKVRKDYQSWVESKFCFEQ